MELNYKVKGLKELVRAFKKYPLTVNKEIADAEDAILEAVTPDLGGGHPMYPPETSANAPPTPYYIRYRGTQYIKGNNNSSEQMGERFYVNTHITSRYIKTSIGNSASYAPNVIGEEQNRFLAAIGWQRLLIRANKNMAKITEIYNDAVRRALRKLKIKFQ